MTIFFWALGAFALLGLASWIGAKFVRSRPEYDPHDERGDPQPVITPHSHWDGV